jgi:hypothetical protein
LVLAIMPYSRYPQHGPPNCVLSLAANFGEPPFHTLLG